MARRRFMYNRLPSSEELSRIPLVSIAEFDIPDKEMKDLRKELYRINKDGIRRYRTLREDSRLLVWRLK